MEQPKRAENVFTLEERKHDYKRIFDYARTHGLAIIVDDAGRTVGTLGFNIHDLTTAEDDFDV